MQRVTAEGEKPVLGGHPLHSNLGSFFLTEPTVVVAASVAAVSAVSASVASSALALAEHATAVASVASSAAAEYAFIAASAKPLGIRSFDVHGPV